jgi:hypothetical protein
MPSSAPGGADAADVGESGNAELLELPLSKETMNPPGRSWWCGKAEPLCFRARKECQAMTKGSCKEHLEAYCWISDYGIEKQDVWFCSADAATCRALRAANESRAYHALTECEPWGRREVGLPPMEASDAPAGSGWWCVASNADDGPCRREREDRIRNLEWVRADAAYCFADEDGPSCFAGLSKCEEHAVTALRYGGTPTGCARFE